MNEHNFPITKRIIALLPFLWAGLSALVLLWFFYDWGFDDPYITFRYARNIATGTGFVYNAGEHVLSTTTPLYALILAGLHFVGLDISLWSNVIGCVSLGLGSLAFWYMGKHWNSPLAGAVAMLLFPLSPLLNFSLGGETVLYIVLILYGFLACVRQQYILTAVLFALATLTRADAIVAAGIAGIYVFVAQWDRQSWRSLPWHALLVYILMLMPWAIFAGFYFGYPLPVTLEAKQQQLLLPETRSFFAGLVVQLQGQWEHGLLRWHLPLIVIGVLYMLWLRHHWLLVVGWGVLHGLAYTILGVSSYFWYYTPIIVMLLVLTALGTEAVYVFLQRMPGTRWQQAVSAVLALAVVLSQIYSFLLIRDWADDRLVIYREVGTWLQQNTAPEASVGTLEVGIIGFYSERRMIGFAGLIQPEVAQIFSPARGYDYSAWWAFHQFQPTYLVLQENVFPRLEQDPSFLAMCHRLRVFDDPAYTYSLVVYECAYDEDA